MNMNRIPIHLAVVAATLAGTAGVVAGAATVRDDDQAVSVDADGVGAEPDAPENSILIQAIEQRRLRQIVAKMPSGWPATEVMRRAPTRHSETPPSAPVGIGTPNACPQAGPPPRSCSRLPDRVLTDDLDRRHHDR